MVPAGESLGRCFLGPTVCLTADSQPHHLPVHRSLVKAGHPELHPREGASEGAPWSRAWKTCSLQHPSMSSVGHFHLQALRPIPAARGGWWLYYGDQGGMGAGSEGHGTLEVKVPPMCGRAARAGTESESTLGRTQWARDRGSIHQWGKLCHQCPGDSHWEKKFNLGKPLVRLISCKYTL